ncbi:MAG: hypothetical protein M5U11_16575 [Anaerolineales bacterium]|nr:hypothetical protein [Anaerolineales bacterium]
MTVYLGAASYENKETLQLSWWDGSAWKPLTTIKNGSPRENGKLNRLTFILPRARQPRRLQNPHPPVRRRRGRLWLRRLHPVDRDAHTVETVFAAKRKWNERRLIPLFASAVFM